MKKLITFFLLSIIIIEFSNAQVVKENGKFKNILVNNIFLKSNGLTSLISINFTSDNHYIMQVVTIGHEEVVNVHGTYQIIPKGNSTYLKLFPLQVNKSNAYNYFQDFKIDLFVQRSIYYLLRKFTDNDIKQYATENPLLAQSDVNESKVPLYLLEGSVNFYSKRKITQSEKDAIENAKINSEKKKSDLEEKLKGW